MKTLGRIFLALVLLVVVCGVAFYERPVWIGLQRTHLQMFLARVQSNYVMTPDGRVHYYEAEPRVPGGGIPLVLVHGLADSDESWAPMLVRLKRAGFHVYAPDLLGNGRSPHPADSDYSIATQEKFVADFIQSLGLQKTDIGGWSMGGWIVLKLALDHPEMLDRVVVYDSAGLRFQVGGGPGVFHPKTEADVQVLAHLMEPEGKPLPHFILKDALRTLQNKQVVTDRAMDSMESGKDLVDDHLSGLTEPLLIVWGGTDQLIPLEVAQKMHTLDPQSELDVVEGCGHLAPKTCPGRVAAATADFLKAQPAPQGLTRTLTNMR